MTSQPTQWKHNNPDKTKLMRQREKFKARYGITVEQYDQMVIDRNGKCDICHKVPTGKGSAARLNVDHNHDTGEIRGLLCWQCNVAIGYLKDSIKVLQDAIQYLGK